MTHTYHWLAALICITACISGIDAVETERPEWLPGYWWSIQTRLDITAKDSEGGNQMDMQFSDGAPDYTCRLIETRRLTRGSQQTYDVYNLNFSGTLSGEGTVQLEGFGAGIPVQLRNGTHTGETWVDIATLGTVHTTRQITGDLWMYYLFSWRQVGNLLIDLSEEYEPPRDALNFPIAVGNQWLDDMTLFYYGSYEVTYDLGFGAETIADGFDDAMMFNLMFDVLAIETYKNWDTYRVEGLDPAWSGQLLALYAECAKNYASFSMMDIDMPDQQFTVRELTMDLMAYDVDILPTPTPNPSHSGITLHLNAELFENWDLFRLSRTLVNAGPVTAVDEYIILDVYETYWFWPDWTVSPSYRTRTLAAMTVYPDEVLLTFVWPDTDGSAENLRFWGALLDQATQNLFGSYDVITWGYRDAP